MSTIKFHQDLKVFQKSVEFSMMIFELTKSFPKEECYSLTDQILMRMEGRVLFSDKEVYQNRAGAPTHTNGLFIASMAVSF